MNICAFTSVCGEDERWLEQYLDEIDRLRMPFAMLLDRCPREMYTRVRGCQWCIGTVAQEGKEFEESDKQKVLDLFQDRGTFDWALAWDIDETWHRDFKHRVEVLDQDKADIFSTPWVNLWNHPKYIRTDGHIGTRRREKFLSLRKRWRWLDPITNGPYPFLPYGAAPPATIEQIDLPCIHWGFITPELRREHKARWDRIYTAAVGRNPYPIFTEIVDESQVPVLVEHDYF